MSGCEAPLVEDEVLVVGEEVRDGDVAVSGRANDCGAICSLVVRLDDLIVFAVPGEELTHDTKRVTYRRSFWGKKLRFVQKACLKWK